MSTSLPRVSKVTHFAVAFASNTIRWMAAIRRCQRFFSREGGTGRGSPELQGSASGHGAGIGDRGYGRGTRGRATIGVRAEVFMERFRKRNPV